MKRIISIFFLLTLMVCSYAFADDIMDHGLDTPVLTDQIWGIDDPGGTPDDSRFTIQSIADLLWTDLAAGDIPDISATYEVQLANEAGLYAVLADVTDFCQPGSNETITGDWVNTDNPWADNEVADNITIDLSTLATNFTCTDNEATAEEALIVFVDGATGSQGGETDGDFTYNPSTGTLTVTALSIGPSATPGATGKDTGCPGADEEIGKFYWDYVDGADGSENGDFFLQAMQGGSEHTFLQFDESDDTVEVKDTLDPEMGVKALTPVTDSTADFAANFTGANLYGGTFVANADDGDLVLPVMAVGMNFTIITLGAIEVVADTNAADGYLMDGTTGAEGANLTNLSTAGDIAVFQYYTADDWLITTNGWTAE